MMKGYQPKEVSLFETCSELLVKNSV